MASKEWGDKYEFGKDKWLPQDIAHYALTPRGEISNDARVADLINSETKGWKRNLVHELFRVDHADVIGQLPIRSNNNSDRQIWSAITNGEFTVRSAYHLQNEILATDRGECS